MNKIGWKPVTVDECMTALGQVLTAEENDELIKSTKKELIVYHHGLGRWMRNNWDLWQGGALKDHMQSLGFMHPDDMSQSLIEEYWARKNNQPSTMKQDVKEYGEYWEEIQKNKVQK